MFGESHFITSHISNFLKISYLILAVVHFGHLCCRGRVLGLFVVADADEAREPLKRYKICLQSWTFNIDWRNSLITYRNEIPLSESTMPTAALCTGDTDRSAAFTSHTCDGESHTSGVRELS